MSKLKNPIVLILIFLPLFLFFSCKNESKKEIVEIDFSKITVKKDQNSQKTSDSITVAISAMISPKETYIFYQHLLNYISEEMTIPITLKQRKTYQEINDLFRHKQLDLAFICSGAYIHAKNDMSVDLMVIPIVNNEPHYYAYIITRKDISINKFEDLYEHSFAFTDKLSNTGRLYPLFLIRQYNRNPNKFFSKIIYTNAHDKSIHAVNNGFVDGASVDSLIFNYIKKSNPEDIANIKIIKKSPPFGIPPIVVSKELDQKKRKKLEQIFLNMNQDKDGKLILEKLMIDRFDLVKDSLYDSIKRMNDLMTSIK